MVPYRCATRGTSLRELEHTHSCFRMRSMLPKDQRTSNLHLYNVWVDFLQLPHYHISPVIKQCFSFQNNPKDLDLSYKTDLDLWDCLGRVNVVL